ncbi:branched-chain amino acid transport system II carrier protein [Thermoflavimicrobium dichotomicum]|uniref:Branched-chain amino acid transport system carrier protein n=1 Tax=Thermoflavimicrobium dichotomicum TaxID=46223 RepID=A0A1I3JDN9_9BACL|nr:branched-chain amino acid transport system II carrier protein [Thermoflavimicrobium dichotomicum]SFI58240.1 branched-chain amino acid:cation transporter, LIVCS family [Thermoflavimicrobium dichotomicum]
MKEQSENNVLSIGLMLFALFFGAGNLIFPPFLGQAAGDHFWTAILGFLITGVGLPLLGVVAVAYSGGSLQTIAGKIHPKFGIFFTFLVYLVIGPLFALPRTGTVSFELMSGFLPDSLKGENWPLIVYTFLYFAVTLWLSINPSKLVDIIGKILTPILFIAITLLFIKGLITPIGDFGQPTELYAKHSFFKGFVEGYLTMDTLGALVFGIVVVQAVKERGVTDPKQISFNTVKAGIIAALGLAFVYLVLGYLGATSQSLGSAENGGQILSKVSYHLFGGAGAILLSVVVTLACLTTSIGLSTACAQYFSERIPKASYNMMLIITIGFSLVVANFGLTQLISFSVPVLVAVYPVAIALIFLSFLDRVFRGYSQVYICTIMATALVSVVDGLKAAHLEPGSSIMNLYGQLPLFNEGMGWLIPAVAGMLFGYLWGLLKHSSSMDKVMES